MIPPAPLLLLLFSYTREEGSSSGSGHLWQCPRSCVCAGDILDCSGRGLSDAEAPAGVPDRFSMLDLSGNALMLVPAFLWGADNGMALARVVHMALARNRISTLAPGLLGRAVPRAEWLDFSLNALCEIPRDAFVGLVRLHVLALQGNKISWLSRGAFRGLPALRRLYLGANRLSALPVLSVLRGVPSLVLLDLSSNRARSFPPSPSPAQLRVTAVFLHGNPFACGCRMARTLGALRGAGYRPVLDHWPDFHCIGKSVYGDDGADDGVDDGLFDTGKMRDVAEILSDGAKLDTGSPCVGTRRHRPQLRPSLHYVVRAGANISLNCPMMAVALLAGDEEPASYEWITPDNQTVGASLALRSAGTWEAEPARERMVAMAARNTGASRLLIVDAATSDSGVYSCRRRPGDAIAHVWLTVVPYQQDGGDGEAYYDDGYGDDGSEDEPVLPNTTVASVAESSSSTLLTMVTVCAASLLLVLAYIFLTPCPCRRYRCYCPRRRGRYGGAMDFVSEDVAPFPRGATAPPAPSIELLVGALAVKRVAFLEP